MKNENTKRGGVYQIRNKLNGKIYIGSSNNMERRWKEHKRNINIGKHGNTHMQNYVNLIKDETGISVKKLDDIFYFGCLEYEDDVNKRNKLEQKYLDLLFEDRDFCYNQEKYSICQDYPRTKTPEETKKKMSAASKKRWEDPAYADKMSKIYNHPEYVKKVSSCIKEKYEDPKYRKQLYDIMKISNNKPEFKEKVSISVKKCWENPKIREKLQAKIDDPEVKRKKLDSKIKSGTLNPFLLVSNTGNIIYVEFYAPWCKKNGLEDTKIAKLRDGEISEYKGYRLHIGPQAVRESNLKFWAITNIKYVKGSQVSLLLTRCLKCNNL